MNASKLYALKTNDVEEIRVKCQYCGDLIRITKDNAAAILRNRKCPTCETTGWGPVAGLWVSLTQLNAIDRIAVQLVYAGE